MTIKIKLILAAGALLTGALLAWYVQGLRADNAALRVSLAQTEALANARARQLDLMQSSIATLEAARQAGQQQTLSLQKAVSQARALGREKGDNDEAIESAVAVIIAERLNSIGQP